MSHKDLGCRRPPEPGRVPSWVSTPGSGSPRINQKETQMETIQPLRGRGFLPTERTESKRSDNTNYISVRLPGSQNHPAEAGHAQQLQRQPPVTEELLRPIRRRSAWGAHGQSTQTRRNTGVPGAEVSRVPSRSGRRVSGNQRPRAPCLPLRGCTRPCARGGDPRLPEQQPNGSGEKLLDPKG